MNEAGNSDRPTSPWRIALVAVPILLAAAALLYVVDPVDVDWLPKCPVYQLTGWHCPGCGITRALHALLHGDLRGALAKNPLLVAGAPFFIGYCLWKWSREGSGWSNTIPARSVIALLVLMFLYAVLRNLPGYPFNLLAPH